MVGAGNDVVCMVGDIARIEQVVTSPCMQDRARDVQPVA